MKYIWWVYTTGLQAETAGLVSAPMNYFKADAGFQILHQNNTHVHMLDTYVEFAIVSSKLPDLT